VVVTCRNEAHQLEARSAWFFDRLMDAFEVKLRANMERAISQSVENSDGGLEHVDGVKLDAPSDGVAV
jgi:hypothetical protein